MSRLFVTVLNMSLTSCVVIGVIFLIRYCIRRLPKRCSCLLWLVVLFRLLCPISLNLPVSALFPAADAAETTAGGAASAMQYVAPPETRAEIDNAVESGTTTIPSAGAKPSAAGRITAVCAWVWLAGMVAAAGYAAYNGIVLRQRLATAFAVRENIFESERIGTAFVLGVIRPRIYLPLGLPEKVRETVLLHERTHLRRGDHIVKRVFFAAAVLHWFNPLVWLALRYMCIDIERACDEAVLRASGGGEAFREEYGRMLLALGTGKRSLLSVSFAENSIMERVKNIMKYNAKTKLTIASIAAIVLAALAAVLCLVNPAQTGERGKMLPLYVTSPEVVTDGNAEYTLAENITEFPDGLRSAAAAPTITVTDEFIEGLTRPCLFVCDGSQAENDYKLAGAADLSNLAALDRESFRAADIRVEHFTHRNAAELAKFANLVELTIYADEMDDLSPLKALTKLQSLSIHGECGDYSFVKSMPELVAFDGSFPAGKGDLSPFADHEKLEHLWVTGDFADLSPLETLPSLFNLRLDNRLTADLPDFTKCPKLHTLAFCNVDDLSALSGCRSIATLYVIDSPLTDISPLSGLPNLTALALENTAVTDITPLMDKEFERFRYEGEKTNLAQLGEYKARHPECIIDW